MSLSTGQDEGPTTPPGFKPARSPLSADRRSMILVQRLMAENVGSASLRPWRATAHSARHEARSLTSRFSTADAPRRAARLR